MNTQSHDQTPTHPDHTPHGHPDHGNGHHPDHARHQKKPHGGHRQKEHDKPAPAHHKPREGRKRAHHRSAGLDDAIRAAFFWYVPRPADGGWMH